MKDQNIQINRGKFGLALDENICPRKNTEYMITWYCIHFYYFSNIKYFVCIVVRVKVQFSLNFLCFLVYCCVYIFLDVFFRLSSYYVTREFLVIHDNTHGTYPPSFIAVLSYSLQIIMTISLTRTFSISYFDWAFIWCLFFQKLESFNMALACIMHHSWRYQRETVYFEYQFVHRHGFQNLIYWMKFEYTDSAKKNHEKND